MVLLPPNDRSGNRKGEKEVRNWMLDTPVQGRGRGCGRDNAPAVGSRSSYLPSPFQGRHHKKLSSVHLTDLDYVPFDTSSGCLGTNLYNFTVDRPSCGVDITKAPPVDASYGVVCYNGGSAGVGGADPSCG